MVYSHTGQNPQPGPSDAESWKAVLQDGCLMPNANWVLLEQNLSYLRNQNTCSRVSYKDAEHLPLGKSLQSKRILTMYLGVEFFFAANKHTLKSTSQCMAIFLSI